MAWNMSSSNCICVSGVCSSTPSCMNGNCTCNCTESTTGETNYAPNIGECAPWMICNQESCSTACLDYCDNLAIPTGTLPEVRPHAHQHTHPHQNHRQSSRIGGGNNTNRKNTMRKGGRTRPAPRGRGRRR